jgi:anti-sigma factor RsiW
MKCAEVEEKLSEYLEALLDRDTADAVRDHLAACARCREELRLLDETRQAVTALPSIDLPAGFTQRVMARVREEAERPNLFQRLFRPFHIKIPIHALALLIIGGIAVYLYQTHRPVVPVATESTPSLPETSAERKSNAPAAPPSKAKESFASPPPERKLEEKRADELGRMKSSTGAMEEAAGKSSALSSAIAAPPDYRLTVTVQGKYEDSRTRNSKLQELVNRLGGKYISPDRRSATAERDQSLRSKVIWVSIPADRFDRFKTELAAIGRIDQVSGRGAPSPESAAPSVPAPLAKPGSSLRIELTFRPSQ